MDLERGRGMKKLLIGSMALAAMIAGPAMAADMPVKAKAPPPPLLYDWSGVYVGFNAGGTWYDVDRTYPHTGGGIFSGAGAGNHTTSDSDAIYGFHAGFQGQWGAWVLGIEAALSGCFRECRSVSGVLPVPIFNPNLLSEHKITNLFTVGPRLGYAWDRWMIFGTGGYATANLKGTYCSSITNVCGPPFSPAGFNGQSWNHGWFVGAGIEYMVHKGPLVDVVLGAEYQHYEVDAKLANCFNAACNPTNGNDYELAAKGDIIRARLTIKTPGWGYFGAPAPVVAKY
jgi:outer membrane immunogenic protein